eukprot:scaffold1603_cov415-Prasinococcus_capsulatus_cf.AAC.9
MTLTQEELRVQPSNSVAWSHVRAGALRMYVPATDRASAATGALGTTLRHQPPERAASQQGGVWRQPAGRVASHRRDALGGAATMRDVLLEWRRSVPSPGDAAAVMVPVPRTMPSVECLARGVRLVTTDLARGALGTPGAGGLWRCERARSDERTHSSLPPLQKGEDCIVLSNHCGDADWLCGWILAQRLGRLGTFLPGSARLAGLPCSRSVLLVNARICWEKGQPSAS